MHHIFCIVSENFRACLLLFPVFSMQLGKSIGFRKKCNGFGMMNELILES